MVAAVIGGGISVATINFPKILSVRRQAALFLLGLGLSVSAVAKEIIRLLPPPPPAIKEMAPVLMAPGDTRVFYVEVEAEGVMTVQFKKYEVLGGGHCGGECGLRLTLCQSGGIPCADAQVGGKDELGMQVRPGPATVKLYNFQSNPWMRPTVLITYPRHPYFSQ